MKGSRPGGSNELHFILRKYNTIIPLDIQTEFYMRRGYSYRSASITSWFMALKAGYRPAPMPIPAQMAKL